MSRIQVLQDFRGKFTGERLIAQGVYTFDDPALYGQGQWLIDNGYALLIEAPITKQIEVGTVARVVNALNDRSEWDQVVTDASTINQIPDKDAKERKKQPESEAHRTARVLGDRRDWNAIPDYEGYTKAELVNAAKEAGVVISSNMTKAEIISAITGLD